MKIEIEPESPFQPFSYVHPPSRRVQKSTGVQLERRSLPLYLGSIQSSHSDLDGLIVTSDLQGHVKTAEGYRLIGEVIPEVLAEQLNAKMPDVDLRKVAVLLCGDLFALIERRGGLGDVREVWRAFKQHFGPVIGVAGNHDAFGSEEELTAFRQEEGITLLHNECVTVGNLTIAGISGIMGNPNKPNRVAIVEYVSALEALLSDPPDLLLLHEVPIAPEHKLRGNELVREVLERSPKTQVACGHCHWPIHQLSLDNGTQVLNVDSKCFFLRLRKEGA